MDITFGKKIEGTEYFTRPGAYLICIKNGHAATVRIPKGYFLIGGGIEGNETHKECIIRECLEETGYDIEVENFICTTEAYFLTNKEYFHPVQYCYSGNLKKKIVNPIEKDHFVEWLPLELVNEKMYLEQQAWAIHKYYSSICNREII